MKIDKKSVYKEIKCNKIPVNNSKSKINPIQLWINSVDQFFMYVEKKSKIMSVIREADKIGGQKTVR